MRVSRPLHFLLLLGLALATGGWPSLGTGGSPSTGKREIHLKDTLGDAAFPDDFWKVSTPEAEGMDGAKLEAAVQAMESRRWDIHSFLVIRHGKLVLERYGTDDDGKQLGPDDLHQLWSNTKTFIGSLIGIAIAERKIPSVSARVLPFFGKDEIANVTSSKERMTIEDLLTMRSGLSFQEGTVDVLLTECAGAKALSRPMEAEPGTRWNYSSGDSQILAEILRRATGETPQAYAEKRLFDRIGIRRLRWAADAGGTSGGGYGLWLRPRDLARFGLLYLSKGRWKGEQVSEASPRAASTGRRCSSSRIGI